MAVTNAPGGGNTADIYLKIDSIPGESTDGGHANWIDIRSFSIDISQNAGVSRSAGGGAGAGRVTVGDIAISHFLDSASPKFFLACCKGEHMPTVTFEFCRRNGNALVKYLVCKLEDVIITSVSSNLAPHDGGGAPRPMEGVTLNFGKITWTYTPANHQTGAPGTPIITWWSQVTNTGG